MMRSASWKEGSQVDRRTCGQGDRRTGEPARQSGEEARGEASGKRGKKMVRGEFPEVQGLHLIKCWAKGRDDSTRCT